MRLMLVPVAALVAACAAPAFDNARPAQRTVLATPPTEAKGGTSQPLGAIDLAPEVNLPAHQLRARSVTIQPGGYLAVHTHQGRPTMEYVAQGTVIEIRNGQQIEHKAGTMVQAINGVTHWWENHGTVPVVLVPVDVFKP